MPRKLITLSSPIAIRTSTGETKMVITLEGTLVGTVRGDAKVLILNISKYYCSTTQAMLPVLAACVHIKASNIRSEQEVA